MKDCRIRPACPEDAPSIVDLLRRSFAAGLVRMTVYACTGIVKFISRTIAIQHCGGETYYTVALRDEALVGFVEIRRCSDSFFVNYMTVAAPLRSRGLGTRLLDAAIRLARPQHATIAALDVFEGNGLAAQWYECLGFQQAGILRWWTVPLVPGPSGSAYLLDYAMADACQREYGFSQFRIVADSREWDVGQLGTEWFRLKSAEALVFPGVASTLARLDAARRVLLVEQTEDPHVDLPDLREMAVFRRLSVPVENLLRTLNAKVSRHAT